MQQRICSAMRTGRPTAGTAHLDRHVRLTVLCHNPPRAGIAQRQSGSTRMLQTEVQPLQSAPTAMQPLPYVTDFRKSAGYGFLKVVRPRCWGPCAPHYVLACGCVAAALHVHGRASSCARLPSAPLRTYAPPLCGLSGLSIFCRGLRGTADWKFFNLVSRL